MPETPISTRRKFIAGSAAAAFSFQFVPRHVIGGPGQIPPSERINFAGVGAGGMGGGDIREIAALGGNVIAMADVDDRSAAGNYAKFPKARRYKDFREMLDKEEKNIDAVTVGTPDHIHALASMAAIVRGKHVYCEKPLTHTIYEARQLALAAKEHKVVTQMGNQGHASEGARLTNEWIQAGIIGEVREVHAWTDRAGKLWKQGIGRPGSTPPVPAELDWNLWCGPAQERPYHSAYCPHNWRGWWDFGTGAMGDMGCHIVDHPVWALELGPPESVEAVNTLDGSELDGKPNFETYPIATVIYYRFPARGARPPVTMTWYEGGLMPPTPPEMDPGRKLPGNGVLYIGSKGKMYHSSHGGTPVLLPNALREEAVKVNKTIPRSPGHRQEWVLACKGQGTAVSDFGYSGPMTETVLLGILAQRAPGKRLLWDSENLRVTNMPELNSFVHKEYRKGWSL
ncbi:MAG: putative dehydrogenase [Verrucomicrobiales bacterium]|jgi:predicted dehydrogenase